MDNDAGDAAPGGLREHHLAEDCVAEVAARIDHDDVAGNRDVERFVDHQIVAGARLHGQSGTGHAASRMHRPERGAARGHARHHIADVGDRKGASPFDPFACDNTLAGKDPEPYGHINPIENGTPLRIV